VSCEVCCVAKQAQDKISQIGSPKSVVIFSFLFFSFLFFSFLFFSFLFFYFVIFFPQETVKLTPAEEEEKKRNEWLLLNKRKKEVLDQTFTFEDAKNELMSNSPEKVLHPLFFLSLPLSL
jgi:hypothetical protein